MKRKWIKWVSSILLAPIILFVILIILLYLPPIQNLLRREVTLYASERTGMQVSIDRIDLRFPLNLLVRGVEVIQQPDTLLSLESLNVRVQVLPLLKGKLEVDAITLNNGKINSVNLINGMQLKGVLGHFFLQSHGVDLLQEYAVVNRVEVFDTNLLLTMNDSTSTPKDTANATFGNWKVDLHQLRVKNVSFGIEYPIDSVRMKTTIAEATVNSAKVDLRNNIYGLNHFLLSGATTTYDANMDQASEGFDPSHIALRNVAIELDSLFYGGRDANAVIREITMEERSGLSLTSFTGRLYANDSIISLPNLKMRTPHSEMNFSAHTYWKFIQRPNTKNFSAKFDAYIGKEDVMLFAGMLPKAFKEAYPFRPLVIHLASGGNFEKMEISHLSVDLPGAFSLKGGGTIQNLSDTLKRSGSIGFDMLTQNLDFLAGLNGIPPNDYLVVPDSMNIKMKIGLNGPLYKVGVDLTEGTGRVSVGATLNHSTENYSADLMIEDFQLHHFLPKDSIFDLSLSAKVKGRGLDVMSHHSSAQLDLLLGQLHYARYHLTNVHLGANLNGALLKARLISDNMLLKMNADGEYNLASSRPDGKVNIDVSSFDLYKIGVIPKAMKHPLSFNLSAEVRPKSLFINLTSGDLKFQLSTHSGIYSLMHQSTRFVDLLAKQIDNKLLDQVALREVLPVAKLSFSAKHDNLLAYYLDMKNISFNNASLVFSTAPYLGINGKAAIHALKVDTLQLDTVSLNIKQDSTSLKLVAGVINGPKNPQFSFSTTLTGEIRNRDAELLVEYKNAQGETGVLLGVNASPFAGRGNKGGGLVLKLTPAEPIVAFRKFHFNENHNWIYLHNNMRVYANVDMWDDEGMGFRVHSVPEDSISLQNINVEIRRIRLDEITGALPYFPKITGLFSAEAHYIQTEKNLQLSTEASIEELTYEHQRIGNVTLGATWLPGERGKQYLDAYLNHDSHEIMVADGKLFPMGNGNDSIEVNGTLEHFPLHLVNTFIPNGLVLFSGDVDGQINLTGSTEKPLINGELVLDSVSALSRQYGANFLFDDRPVQLKDNRLVFDKFAIYTTEKNPFTVDGYIDFRDMSRPMANLNLLAENYTLLNAKRTRESLVYGKVFADLKATLRGSLDGLNMRGSMNLLGNTDVSYVLTDSPLTVQDRLGSLVSFTSFSDTTSVMQPKMPSVSLGGLDMIMMLHIDPSVRVKVDLDASDNRIEFEGGGDLSMKYTPQGDLSMSGRYTLSSGLMKYALPIIAVKEFAIDNGSYVEWTGKTMDPMLNFKATDRIRASVPEGENGGTRMVNFDVSIVMKNRLDNLSFAFDVSAPEDASIQNELTAMGAEERGKQALYIMLMKTYLGTGPIGGGGGGLGKINMGTALNSVLSSQINSLMGNLKNASFSVGVEDHDASETGGKRRDYSFRYSQRLFNNRFQIVVGGKVSTGENATNNAESFIDNISLEYRLDRTGTRYVRLFYDKNYESVLEGEITETGVGLVLRKKLDNLSELFIFKK